MEEDNVLLSNSPPPRSPPPPPSPPTLPSYVPAFHRSSHRQHFFAPYPFHHHYPHLQLSPPAHAHGFPIHPDHFQHLQHHHHHHHPQQQWELEHGERISGCVQPSKKRRKPQDDPEQLHNLRDGEGGEGGEEISCACASCEDGGDSAPNDDIIASETGACSGADSRVRVRVSAREAQIICTSPVPTSMPLPLPSTQTASLSQAVSSTAVVYPLLPVDTSQGVDIPATTAMESSFVSDKKYKKKKRKKLKLVQIHLEPFAHQKLMKLVRDQHEGSLETFVNSMVNANAAMERPGKRLAIRKTTLTKWKRVQFNELKGNEMHELASAFRTLADLNPDIDVTPLFLDTPWQELCMGQLEKMLEETKRLLLCNEKMHDCPHIGCGRHFSTLGSLKDHLNEHSGERPYLCKLEGCVSRFSSKQMLCRHMKKHERAHRCTFDGCNKRFAFRERLIVHQKTHCDERPLICPWENCGKSFKWENSLQGHMRTHTREKPFHCMFSGCGRLFGYKVDLTRHVRTHYGQPARLPH